MRIRAGVEISYESPAPSPILMMLSVHPDRRGDLETPDILTSDRDIPIHTYCDAYGNLCSRAMLPAGSTTFSTGFIIRDSGLHEALPLSGAVPPVEEVPDEAVVWLLGSRYCETDRMVDLAWSLFGRETRGWPLVKAILDYTHNRIAFGYHDARNTRTAFEAHEEGVGVCRDYAHLAITLFRCMNIPARYCAGYMGDIGIPKAGVMDLSAWAEVWLDGRWWPVDARHNFPRIGRIVMARGRDAVDTAITTSFGAAQMTCFKVTTEEILQPGQSRTAITR